MSDTERMLSLALIHAASDPKVTREALEEIQGLAKDPQRLRALLESEGLGGEEGEGDEEEEPDPEDVPIGKRYRGSLRPADLTIGKRYRPTVTKAATATPVAVEPDEDTGPALARWYAGWFEALEASGLEVSESDLAAAEDELDGTGWCVGRDDDGEWEARATRTLGKKSWRFAHLTKAAQRAPSGYSRGNPFRFGGKEYVGGQFIPGKAIEEASPQDRAKLQAAKETEAKKAEASKAVRGATAVDPVALAHTLSQHAGAVELTKAERGNAARAYAALQRHHGDLTLHRIGELAARAEQAWRSITDDDPNSEGLRSYWTRQLAAMAGWVERAKGEGLTGEARGKPVDAVVEEVREGAPAFDVAAHVTSAVGDDPGEWMAYDVHRALEDAPSEMIGAVADHFLARRPDMADKIADAVHDARVDRGLALQTEPSPEEARDASATAESLTKFKAGHTPIVSSSLRPGAALFHPDGSRASFVEATSPGWMTIRHQDGITDEVATADWYVTKEEPVSRPQAEPSIIPDLLASRPSDGAEFVKPLRELYYRQEEARATGDAAAVARINAEMAGLKQKEEESRANHAQWRSSMVAALADPSSLSGDDYAAGMAAIEGRKDMAHGNAVKLAMRTLGLSGKKGAELAEQLVSGAEATRAGTAHFAGQPRTGYDKPTAGVNVGVQYRRAEDVYRAIHAAASDPHFTGTLTDSAGRTYHFVDGKRVAGDQSTEIPVDNGADADRIPPGEENTGGTTMSQELNAAQVRMQSEAVAHAQGRADRLRARGMVEDADHYAAVADYLRTAGADFWVKQGTGRRVEEIALVAGELMGREPAPVAPATPAAPESALAQSVPDPAVGPTTPEAAAVEQAEDAGATPREAATAAAEASTDYEFARESAIPNVGEDLKGSARHTRNHWSGLEQAEKDGTAAELVTRESLLKNEPHNLAATIEPSSVLSHLAAHLALNAFPPTMGDASSLNVYLSASGRLRDPGRKTAPELRAQYYEAYQTIRETAEKAATEETDPRRVLERVARKTNELISRYRQSSGSGLMSHVAAGDRYNPVANALIDLQKRVTGSGNKSTHVMSRVLDFAGRLKSAYGETTLAMLDRAQQHVLDVMEGESFNKTFDTGGGGPRRFTASDAYVKHATRKGGRVIDASTVKAGTDYIMSNLGMRGLQWGNSVSDDERQHHLTKTAEAMADLADVVGLPDSAMSLTGTLGLAIGARGRGNAAAHYEPGTKVINLTRKNGAGSLAHEWAHALDHHVAGGEILMSSNGPTPMFLSEQRPQATEWSASGGNRVIDRTKDPLWQAMNAVQTAMKESGFTGRIPDLVRQMQKEGKISSQVLGKPAGSYWNSPPERFARVFERYVQHKLEGDGRENTYLSGVGDHMLWPTKEEIARMAPAMDRLFAVIRESQFKPA